MLPRRQSRHERQFLSTAAGSRSRDALNEQGFNAELTEINGHTHDYYGSSSAINKSVWAFLKDKHLERDPQYQDYAIPR